jgi:two-component system chemotaxis response regulator CheY
MKALIVDDSRAMRRILASVVRDLGFETAEAGSLREADAILAAEPKPELLLLDWNLPDGEGVDLLRRVRAEAGTARALVVMITSEASQAHMSSAMQAGANEYVTKPFDRESLQDKLGLLGLLKA